MIPNFKALGIDKLMNEEFKYIEKSALQKIIDSHYFEVPLIIKRREEQMYCTIKIIDTDHCFWYNNLLNFEFFCMIRFKDYGYGEFISEFIGVQLSNNKTIIFRTFSPKHVTII